MAPPSGIKWLAQQAALPAGGTSLALSEVMPIPASKQWKDEKEYEAILEKAIITFDAQYKLLKVSGKNIETTKGINKRALEYLLTFLHCAMRAQQLDPTSEKARQIQQRLFEKLWGSEATLRYIKELIAADQNNDEELKDGRSRAVMAYRQAAQTGNQPMGWFACFDD